MIAFVIILLVIFSYYEVKRFWDTRPKSLISLTGQVLIKAQ